MFISLRTQGIIHLDLATVLYYGPQQTLGMTLSQQDQQDGATRQQQSKRFTEPNFTGRKDPVPEFKLFKRIQNQNSESIRLKTEFRILSQTPRGSEP
mmetsp:Transcript_4225/g.6196  ORF Transcript_4225/g.6196 Transcript_4225/m.6196 type:complete len:97 (+) Transcript_4225:578-868(+)